MNQDRKKKDSLFVFPDRALEENSFNLLFLRVFPLDRSVFQNSSISRQLLAKDSWWRWSFINNLLHKRIPSRWPCSDWLPANVVFEVQAHAVTQSMRILNFIASNSGAYDVLIQSKFSLKWQFTKKKLVELFVEDVLGFLIHLNGIFWDSSE